MQIASPYKLKSGHWGAKIKGTATEGETILIRAKSGKSWQATVKKVVWYGDGVSLVATGDNDGPSPRRRSQSSGEYCGYPCPVTGRKCCPANGPCHDCM